MFENDEIGVVDPVSTEQDDVTSVDNQEIDNDNPEVDEEAAEPQASEEKPQQTAEQNAFFAEQRRKQELEATRQQLAAVSAEKDRIAKDNQRFISALQGYGYQGSAQEIADQIEASQRQVNPEVVRREREAVEAQTKAQSTIQEAERIRQEAYFDRDLAEIQRINPNVKSVFDLGERFLQLRAAGIGNLEAYEIVSKPKAKAAQSSKDHLITTSGGKSSGGLVEIPKSEVEMWKDSFPDDTPTKLKERYNRALKRQGE